MIAPTPRRVLQSFPVQRSRQPSTPPITRMARLRARVGHVCSSAYSISTSNTARAVVAACRSSLPSKILSSWSQSSRTRACPRAPRPVLATVSSGHQPRSAQPLSQRARSCRHPDASRDRRAWHMIFAVLVLAPVAGISEEMTGRVVAIDDGDTTR